MRPDSSRHAAGLDLDMIRRDFPITRRMVYLNNASIGPLSNRVVSAVNDFLSDVRDNGRIHYPDWCRKANTEIKSALARLIGADPSEIAFTKNTTEGLNIVANGLDWQEGDNVVIADIEYPSNVYPWMNLKRRGVGVKWLRTPHGRISPDMVRTCIDSRTRLVSLSAVQFSNGFRLDIDAVGSICREMGVLLNLDAIQYVGALDLTLADLPVDFLSAGGHKWMLGPIGTGIFYCRKERLTHIHPSVVGYHSVDKSEDHMDYDLTYRAGAARFEEALVNFPGIWGLKAAADTLLELGMGRIEAHIMDLTRRALEGLKSQEYEILSPSREGERSGILSFRHADIPPENLRDRLAAANIETAIRGSGLRLSPSYYNTADEIDALLDALP